MHTCQRIIDQHGGIKPLPIVHKIEYTQTDSEQEDRDSFESDSGPDDFDEDLENLNEEVQNPSDFSQQIKR
jgi:hypothetical protein